MDLSEWPELIGFKRDGIIEEALLEITCRLPRSSSIQVDFFFKNMSTTLFMPSSTPPSSTILICTLEIEVKGIEATTGAEA